MTIKLNISVHDLVDTILRSGDIDNRFFNLDTMNLGSKIHKYYQDKMGKDYYSEYFLSYTFNYENFDIYIQGRADGIIIKNDIVQIDEIKSSNKDLDEFYQENEEWHLGQAKVYGFLYGINNPNVKEINIRLTYISQFNLDIKTHDYKYRFEELSAFFYFLLDEYLSLQNLYYDHVTKRNIEVENIPFPYNEYNKYQKDLINFINERLNIENEYSFIEAPTGIGKTISFLYASLKYIKKYNKIFYLTAKNSGKDTIKESVSDLNKYAKHLKTIIITSKEKLCMLDQPICNPEECPFARKYYNKLNEILRNEFLSDRQCYDNEYFLDTANKYEICPFEFQLDLSKYCDVLAMDYNYVFDPFVYLDRYISDEKNNYLLLIDEAHNLIDRSRNMYSASIDLNQFLRLHKYDKKLPKKVKNNLVNIIEYMQIVKSYKNNDGLYELENKFINFLTRFESHYQQMLDKDYKKISQIYKDTYLNVHRFLKNSNYLENFKGFKIYYSKYKDNIYIKILCISPNLFIKEKTNKFLNTLFFSATLTPFDYFRKVLLGDNLKYKELSFETPFDEKRLNFIIARNISVKYKDRVSSLNNVLSLVLTFVSIKKGNYIIYCPSYEYVDLLTSKIDFIDSNKIKIFIQKANMKEYEKVEFINEFKKEENLSKVGICVLGGSFSESINLIGDKLIGVCIIGVGLPSFNFENSLINEFYENEFKQGYDFTYLIPGMINVIQAVGRLIRTKDDYGSVLLIDDRFLTKKYLNLFKKEWLNYKTVINQNDVINYVNYFYKTLTNK